MCLSWSQGGGGHLIDCHRRWWQHERVFRMPSAFKQLPLCLQKCWQQRGGFIYSLHWQCRPSSNDQCSSSGTEKCPYKIPGIHRTYRCSGLIKDVSPDPLYDLDHFFFSFLTNTHIHQRTSCAFSIRRLRRKAYVWRISSESDTLPPTHSHQSITLLPSSTECREASACSVC